MSLYSQWHEIAEMERSEKDNQKFWDEYFYLETENYKSILMAHSTSYTGKLSELAATFGMDDITFAGFLDGINSSLKTELDLGSLTPTSDLTLDVDFEKLYFNMLEAKADWLYTLSEWDDILTDDRRAEIKLEHRNSKIYHKSQEVGRNDPCPCGSGKKYKKCCFNS